MTAAGHDSDRIGGFLITLIGVRDCQRWFRNAVFDVAGASASESDADAANGDRVLPVMVSSQAVAEWIEAHYQSAILSAARRAGLDVTQVQIIAGEG